MTRIIEYRGREISLAVVTEQGRWGYRIEDGPARFLQEIREPMAEEQLYREAEAAAKAEVERQERWTARAGRVAAV